MKFNADNILDLGCGYGVVGILAGKLIGQENITMCDIHTDFSVPKHFIEVGFKKLVIGGKLIMVTKRIEQKNKRTTISNDTSIHQVFSL